ncbi:MAG: helix-turn-helix domain-containing protein, partial [Planctomycetota bacterium]
MTDEHDGFPSHEVMTLREVADYLQLAEKSVLRMAQAGRIPAAKVASQWRFMRSIIKDWLASQMEFLPSAEHAPAHPLAAPEALPPLSRLLRSDLMALAVPPGTK